ncbi:MAG: trigger factor [Spirochaetaceae bacterium]|jgi:trigger factor|nr:trigger factor [Spirochaetaceae bacterium]
MTKEITRLEKSVVRLAVTVPRDEVREMYGEAVDELAKTVQIAGFRKGKVPRNVLERKLGAALQEDVLNGFVGKTVKAILEEESFPRENLPLPYSEPVIEGTMPKLDLENDLTFAVTWDARPVFEVETWKGLTAEIADVEVLDADVARELERVRERNAIVMDRQPEEAAQPGDIVKVDYVELDEQGRKISGSERDGFVFTLKSGAQEGYWFEDVVAGMKVGETKTITKEIPLDDDGDTAEGKTEKCTAMVKVTSIKEKKLPELDDELAQDVHEDFETLDDLRQSVRKTLNDRLEERLEKRRLGVILEKLIEKNPIDLPESTIRYEMDSRIMKLAREMGMDEKKIGGMLREENHPIRALAENRRETVVRSLQASLIQDRLIKDLNIEVTDDERDAELKALAERGNTDFDKLKEYYHEQDDRLAYLDNFVATKKVRELLLKENTVTVGAKQSYEAFMEGNSE